MGAENKVGGPEKGRGALALHVPASLKEVDFAPGGLAVVMGPTGVVGAWVLDNRFDYTKREDSCFLIAAMCSKENPDVPAGYLLKEITSGENGVVSLWRSPDGKDHVWTFDGPISEEIERYARRYGITFETAARALVEAGFSWMKR